MILVTVALIMYLPVVMMLRSVSLTQKFTVTPEVSLRRQHPWVLWQSLHKVVANRRKKDLGALFMKYGNIYVASCAIGANFKQTVQAFQEAEDYVGPAIMICYSPCIEHRTKTGLSQMSLDQKEAVDCGYWPLYRFNPDLKKQGQNPFQLDGKKLTGDVLKFLIKQNRYAQLARAAPE